MVDIHQLWKVCTSVYYLLDTMCCILDSIFTLLKGKLLLYNLHFRGHEPQSQGLGKLSDND